MDKNLESHNQTNMVNRKKPSKRAIIKACGGKCAECGTTENLTLHHIVPLSDGGLDEAENFMILCDEHQKRLHGIHKKKREYK